MEVGLLGLMALLVGVGSLVLLVVALVDLVRRPAEDWARSGDNQLVWALIVVFVGLIGPLLYLTIGKPSFDAATVSRKPAENVL